MATSSVDISFRRSVFGFCRYRSAGASGSRPRVGFFRSVGSRWFDASWWRLGRWIIRAGFAAWVCGVCLGAGVAPAVAQHCSGIHLGGCQFWGGTATYCCSGWSPACSEACGLEPDDPEYGQSCTQTDGTAGVVSGNGRACVPPPPPPTEEGDDCETGDGSPGLVDSDGVCQSPDDGDDCNVRNEDGTTSAGIWWGGRCLRINDYDDDDPCFEDDSDWVDGRCSSAFRPDEEGGWCPRNDDGSHPWRWISGASCAISCDTTGQVGWVERRDGSCVSPDDPDYSDCWDADGINFANGCQGVGCPAGVTGVVNSVCVSSWCNESDPDCYDEPAPDPPPPCFGTDCLDEEEVPPPSPVRPPPDSDPDDDDDPTSSGGGGGGPGQPAPAPGGGGGGGLPGGGGSGGSGAGGPGQSPGGTAPTGGPDGAPGGGDGEGVGVGAAACPRGAVWRIDPDTESAFCVCPEDTYDIGGECIGLGDTFGPDGVGQGLGGVLAALLREAREFAGAAGSIPCQSFPFSVTIDGTDYDWEMPPAVVLPYFCQTLNTLRLLVIALFSVFVSWQFVLGFRDALLGILGSGVIGVLLGVTYSVGTAIPAAYSLSTFMMILVEFFFLLLAGAVGDEGRVVLDWFEIAGALAVIRMVVFAVSMRWAMVMSAAFGRAVNWWD